MVLKNPFEENEKNKEIVQVEDFTNQPSFVAGNDFQKSKSLAAAQDTLSKQLSDIQTKMADVRQRREQLGESRADQAERARLNIMTADLQDAANLVGGIGTDLGSRERTQAEKEAMGLQREEEMLGQELAGLEEAERLGEREELGLIGQEEQEMSAAQQAQAMQEMEMMRSDPNSPLSQEARATAELVLGQGSIPPDVSAAQLEQVYPDILENARYQQKQANELMKIGLKQDFQSSEAARERGFEASEAARERGFKASEAEKGRLFKEAQAEQDRALDIDIQAQKLAQTGKAKGKEIKSSQAISAGFGRRMQQALEVFDKLDKQGFDRGSLSAGMGSVLPNFLQSSEQQQQAQAERNFINATLRRESGAAIAESEFESAEKQYFPRAGDSPEVIEQKKRNRDQVIGMMKAEAGPAWDAIELVSSEGEKEGKSASDKLDSGEMPTRKKFVPGQGMAQSSSGRRIFGG